jgi:hypothetical protein
MVSIGLLSGKIRERLADEQQRRRSSGSSSGSTNAGVGN